MPVEHPGPCPSGTEDGSLTREQIRWALKMFEWECAQPPKPYISTRDLVEWAYGKCP